MTKIMTEGSFEFGGINSVDEYGIYVRQHTPIVPPKKLRKAEIPLRNGSYNYGVVAHNDIKLSLDCYCSRNFERADFGHVVSLGVS